MADIFLEYGVNPDGEFVHIGQVGRGRVALGCPYCGQPLIARKGLKIAPHFAHDGDTCNPASRDPSIIALPMFDRFTLDYPGKVVEALRKWVKDLSGDPALLRRHGLIEYNDYTRGYELTKPAKVITGQLSLDLFNKMQEPRIVEHHDQLLERATIAQGTAARLARIEAIKERLKRLEHVTYPLYDRELWAEKSDLIDEKGRLLRQDNATDFQTALTDLRLYRAQWRRILTASLYFLEVTHSGGMLHKIGVTNRPIDERIAEIYADLAPFLSDVTIRPLGVWEHRGNVELYFKYRYAAQRADLGALTEYFTFDKPGDVTRDLNRMQAKVLTPLEDEILRGEKTALERGIEAAGIEARRRAAIRAGMKRKADQGVSVGRPRRTAPETAQEILGRPYAAQVTEALAQKLSLRNAARAAGVSVNTVRKVQAALKGDTTPDEQR